MISLLLLRYEFRVHYTHMQMLVVHIPVQRVELMHLNLLGSYQNFQNKDNSCSLAVYLQP